VGNLKPCLDCGTTGDDRYSGVPQRCRPCHRARVTANRLANLDRVREYDRQRGSRQSAGYVAAYRAENPEKYQARTAVGNAVRDGRLTREPCEICGDVRVHGHHDDYSKPLEVRWLCPVHHKAAHA